MHRIHWWIARCGERLGLLGVSALLILLLSGFYWLSITLPAQARLQQLQTEAHTPAKPKQTQITVDPNTKLQQFIAQFPPLSTRTENVQHMMALAQSMHLAMDDVSYKSETRPDDALTHYHINMSIYAPYPTIRQFIALFLANTPHASLDTIQLSRETTENEIIQARVQLSLHYVL